MSRCIEEKIIAEIEKLIASGKHEDVSLTVRDTVYTGLDTVSYKLWGTQIFTYDRKLKAFMFRPSSNGAGRYIISHTTKSRLNALLWDFCNIGIYQRKNKLYTTNYATELETDKWYVVEKNGLRKL